MTNVQMVYKRKSTHHLSFVSLQVNKRAHISFARTSAAGFVCEGSSFLHTNCTGVERSMAALHLVLGFKRGSSF